MKNARDILGNKKTAHILSNKNFNEDQMREIIFGWEMDVDIEKYADPKFIFSKWSKFVKG